VTSAGTKHSSPPFRADHVGSLLRPKKLFDARIAFDGTNLDTLKSGEGRSSPELKPLEDEAIRQVVALQERVGLKSVTDGEFRRRTFHQDFLLGLEGTQLRYEASALKVDFVDDKGGNRGRGAAFYFVDKVRHVRPVNVDAFNFLKSVTRQTPKVTLPAPTLVLFFSSRELVSHTAYPHMQDFYEDLAECYRREIAALAQAGCTYVQLDDTAFAMICDPKFQNAVVQQGRDPKQLVDEYCQVLNSAISKRNGVTIALHICRGNKEGKWMAEGGYDFVAETVFNKLNVDTFFLEYDTPRAGSFEPLRHMPKSKGVVLGLVTTKSPDLEATDGLKRRIEEASRLFPLERMGISPQCGFSSGIVGNPLSIDDEERKLRLVVDVAREVWRDA
jgi:5-methyltetrahydropteroyltriglutamate--homocysteine methyltransferase